MTVCVCCKTDPVRRRLGEYLTRFSCEEGVELDVSYSEDVSRESDVLLVESEGELESAKRLAGEDYSGSLVLIAADSSLAVEGYTIGALGYLVSPVSYESFHGTLRRCTRSCAGSRRTLTFISNSAEMTVPIADIVYIETSGRGCRLHLLSRTGRFSELMTRRTISSFADELAGEPSFIKLGKSYIANLSHCESARRDGLCMSGGRLLLFPVRDALKLLRAANKYLWKL